MTSRFHRLGIAELAPVDTTVADFLGASYELAHVVEAANPNWPGLRAGWTMWVSGRERPLAIQWDWVEMEPGVTVLADVFDIQTNATLVDAAATSNRDVALILNRVVYDLPWQQAVQSQLVERAPRLRQSM